MREKTIEKMLFLIKKYSFDREDILCSDYSFVKLDFLNTILKNEEIDTRFIIEYKDLFELKKEKTIINVKNSVNVFSDFCELSILVELKLDCNVKTLKNGFLLLKKEDKKSLIRMKNLSKSEVKCILEIESDKEIIKELKLYQY